MTHGEASISRPIAWQEDGGRRIPAAAMWKDAGGGAVRIEVAVSDPSRGVRIDPTVTYASYLGGNSSESYVWTAIDAAGAAYVYASTYSTDFPTTTGAYSRTKKTDGTANARYDLTVSKIASSGSSIVWSTYIGSTSDDLAWGLFVDSAGRAVLAGTTYANDFPITPGAYVASTSNGGGFVTQLNSSGTSLVYSTFTVEGASKSPAPAPNDGVYVLEGSGVGCYGSAGTTKVFHRRIHPTFSIGNQGMGIDALASDAKGDAYVVGETDMENFSATSGAYQTSYAGRRDAFVTKVDSTGAIVWTTFVGGSQDETARDIDVNLAGQAYVLGVTSSSNFPVTSGAYRTTATFPGGFAEGFLTRLNAAGSALRSSTYLGVGLISIEVHGGSSCVLAGSTSDPAIQLLNAFQPTYGGDTDGFVMKFNRDNTLAWSSYYGGSDTDSVSSVGMALDGSVVVAGATSSSDYPTVSPFQQSRAAATDVMLLAVPDTLPTSIAPVVVTTESLPTWTVGYAYDPQTLTATGGIGAYKWTVVSGSLPTGASLSSAGVITGTLTQTGTYTFKVRAEDTCEIPGEKQLSIRVNPPPSISSATMPPATINTPYDRAVPVVDGSGTMIFVITDGVAPPGTELQLSGQLTGTPSQIGVFPFTVRVTDGRGAIGTRQISLQIHPPPVMAATVVPDWTEGRVYTVQFNASLGTGGFTWSVADGTVPTTSPLDPALGKIAGPAGPAGTYEFTLHATDSAGAVASRSFTAKVNAPPTVASSLLPPAAIGRPYAATLAIDGGTPPFTWSRAEGLLPEGLSLNGAAGVIQGNLAGPSAGPIGVQCSDVTGAFHVGSLTIPTAPLVDLEKKHWKETVTIPESGPVPVLRYLELTAGALLRIDVKGGGQIDEGPSARLADADGNEVDLAPWSRSTIKSLSVRGAVVPATGRYYLYVVPAPEATGKMKISVSVAPRTSWTSVADLDAANVLEIPFAAPPGARVSVSVKAAKGSAALPRIVSLLDADDADLLATGRIREKAGSASFSSGTPLLGGDYLLRISTRDASTGAATYRITLKAPQKYEFELTDVASGD